MKKKENAKKFFIYGRYLFPIFFHIAIIVTAFIPSYRFIVDGDVGEAMSLKDFISLYWEKSRNVLFGTAGEYTGSDEVFSTIMFSAIIIFAILFLIAFAISVWNAIVAFRVFLSDDEESAERGRKFFVVFVPNRIVSVILTSLGFFITLLPYFISPISSLTGAGTVKLVIETIDPLLLAAVLIVVFCIISIASAYFEKEMSVDIFAKDTSDGEDEDDEDDEEDDDEDDD